MFIFKPLFKLLKNNFVNYQSFEWSLTNPDRQYALKTIFCAATCNFTSTFAFLASLEEEFLVTGAPVDFSKIESSFSALKAAL